MSLDYNLSLFNFWHAKPEKLNTLITEQLLTTCIIFFNTKHTVAMHCLSLIKHSYNPNYASDSRPNSIAGKENKMEIVCFI